MPIKSHGAAGSICRCEHHAPSLRVIRASGFNTKLAAFVSELNLSGEDTVAWVLTELFDSRTGALIGFDGKKLPIDTDPSFTDELFGVDCRRSINRYISRTQRHHRNRLQSRMVIQVLMIHFAREIYLCRTSGCCASR